MDEGANDKDDEERTDIYYVINFNFDRMNRYNTRFHVEILKENHLLKEGSCYNNKIDDEIRNFPFCEDMNSNRKKEIPKPINLLKKNTKKKI